jgi:hypothetical protein
VKKSMQRSLQQPQTDEKEEVDLGWPDKKLTFPHLCASSPVLQDAQRQRGSQCFYWILLRGRAPLLCLCTSLESLLQFCDWLCLQK